MNLSQQPMWDGPHHPATTSINMESVPRCLVLAASRVVCGRQYFGRVQQAAAVGHDRPEDQPHPVLISPCSHLGHYILYCSEGQNLDTENKRTQSEMAKGLSRPITPVSRIWSAR